MGSEDKRSFLKRLKRTGLQLLMRLIEVITSALLSLIYRGPGDILPPIENLLLLDTASALAFKIRTRKVTSVEVVQTFILRIGDVNQILNCVVQERFKDALKEAKDIDEFIKSGVKTEKQIAQDTPFLGVPFTTKDCIKVKDMTHSAGLYMRKDVFATEDAVVVALMRKAGGIPLALTNVPELCMWWETCNTIYGRTYNPYNTNHIVGGSSGGEACLLAAAGSPMGIGSDIGGSIRMPSFFNGIFGHKPSKYIVSNDGQYPMPTGEQDSFLGIGPMCRFASDLIPMFKILAGKNAKNLSLDEKVDLKKLQFYYMEHDGGSSMVSPVHPEIKDALRKVVFHLDKAHGIKAQKVNIKRLQKSTAIWLAKMKVKDGPTFPQQLANCEGSINVTAELVKWCLCCSNHTFAALVTAVTEIWGIVEGSEQHQYLVEECSRLSEEFKDILGSDGVFLYPTHPTPAPYHNEPLVKPFNFSYTGIINVLGLPATHCPLGLSSRGLPIGIQVVGALNKDHQTLAVALELEKAFGGWVSPSITV